MPTHFSSKVVGFSAAIVVTVVFLFLVMNPTARWVGRKDVLVQFVVYDAVTKAFIPHATVYLRTEAGGFCQDREARTFTLQTDQHGAVKHLTKQCQCFGSEGIAENSFGMHLPRHWFHAEAENYQASEAEFLSTPQHAVRVQDAGTFAVLSVPIRLIPDSPP